MAEGTYLVFGDLHGRVLPAFRLATVWGREHHFAVTALLQVGDLGYFPDTSRLDKATIRHAADDSSELGVQLVTQPSEEADAVFGEVGVPEGLWFTAGNHEDHDALRHCQSGVGPAAAFPVDNYGRLWCLRDGQGAELPGGLRVGALWGIDDEAPRARKNSPPDARIRARSAMQLGGSEFDVLLTHDSPRDAVLMDSGSEEIDRILTQVEPAFHFFGHYDSTRQEIDSHHGKTRIFHLRSMEMHGRGGCVEEGSVGVLTWNGSEGTFQYLDAGWLKTFTRHNWQFR